MKKVDRKVRCLFGFHEWIVSTDEDFETARVKCPECGEVQTFGEARKEWTETAEFQFRENREIRRRSSGISIHWTKHEKEIVDGKETGEIVEVDYEEDVIQGWTLPKRRIIVESDYPYYEIELRPGKTEILTGNQICRQAEARGPDTAQEIVSRRAEPPAPAFLYGRRQGQCHLWNLPGR